jgi:hypothetical protein
VFEIGVERALEASFDALQQHLGKAGIQIGRAT